jgi:hypothetical protein
VVMSKEPLLILGDFNIHVDVAENLDSIKFLDMLESVGLQLRPQITLIYVID